MVPLLDVECPHAKYILEDAKAPGTIQISIAIRFPVCALSIQVIFSSVVTNVISVKQGYEP